MTRPFFAPASITAAQRPDGSMLLRSTVALGEHARTMGEMFATAVAEAGARPFLAERQGEGWRHVTYDEAWSQARGIAAGLIALGQSPERPLLVLAENGIGHGLMMLGAMLAGVPMTPASAA